jgi:hypothetical protein
MSDFKILHQNDYREEEGPGYGIWLILLAINLLTGFYFSVKELMVYWDVISPWSASYYLIAIPLTLAGLYHFWKRKSITPWLLIAFLTLNLLYAVLINADALLGESQGYHFQLFRSAFLCLVAIPYLVLSRHVKKVFVN